MIHVSRSVESVLSKTLNNGVAWGAFCSFVRMWPDIIGKFAVYTEIFSIQGTTLIVGVKNSALLYELHLLQDVIVKKIAKSCSRVKIDTIVFKAMKYTPKTTIPSQKYKKQIVEKEITEKLSAYLNHIVSKIDDPVWRDILRRMYIHCVA